MLIEVEDECGGIPETKDDPFQPFGDRRGNDRTGLGLGLSIARKAVRAHHGDIHIRNLPGKGCIFVIAVPLAVGRSRCRSARQAVVKTCLVHALERRLERDEHLLRFGPAPQPHRQPQQPLLFHRAVLLDDVVDLREPLACG